MQTKATKAQASPDQPLGPKKPSVTHNVGFKELIRDKDTCTKLYEVAKSRVVKTREGAC